MTGHKKDKDGRLILAGAVLTVVGVVGLITVLASQEILGGLVPLLGGLALNAAIVGPALMARRLGPRIIERLPRWLGW